MTPNDERSPPWTVALVGCALVPCMLAWLEADLPAPWLWVLGAAATVGALPSRPAGWMAIVVPGYLAYLSGASSSWDPIRLLGAVVALTALILYTRRLQLALVIGMIATSLVAVSLILQSTPDSGAETRRILLTSTGLALGGTAAVAMAHIRTSVRPRQIGCALVALVAFAAALRPARPLTPEALPAWRALTTPLPSRDNRPALFARLSALRAAGIRDADHAWVGMALQENADPASIRSVCPRGRQSVPLEPASWQPTIELGAKACDAAALHPEEGAARLAQASDLPARGSAALLRLRADLLAESGDLDTAWEVYRRAASRGDPYALRDAAQLFLDSERPVPTALAQSTDPLVRAWLGDDDSHEAWTALNETLDFSLMQPPRRLGMRAISRRGKMKAMLHQQPPYIAVTSNPLPNPGLRVDLPMTPGRRVPGQIELRLRNTFGFRLTLVLPDRTIIFACPPFSPDPDQEVIMIWSTGCYSKWGDALFATPEDLSGPVVQAYMQGHFDLERLAFRRDRPVPEETEE